MNTSEVEVSFSGNKFRDDGQVQTFARRVEAEGLPVKSLNLIVNSRTSLDAQRSLLELPNLSDLESLTITQDFSLGARCLDILVEVLGDGHIRALVNLDLRYCERPELVVASDLIPLTSPEASSNISRNLSSPTSGGTSAASVASSSQSLSSISGDPSQASSNPPLSWKGFASLASALHSGWLPRLKEVELNGNFESRDLGDEGATGVAVLIENGYMSSLKELNLENNSIGNEGFGALVRALRSGKLPHLTLLNLSRNSFQSSGLVQLITALEEGRLPSLERIVLYGAGSHSLPMADTELHGRSVAEAIMKVYHKNTALTATVDIDWPERGLEAKWNVALQRNKKLTRLLKTLNASGRDVPVTNGKVFICGFPGVGKTTLRRTLKRSRWRAYIGNELRSRDEYLPTRGIEVSHITGKMKGARGKFTLNLWDLAGQEEFHVLHSSFLPDLGMANGKATTFLVVLMSTYGKPSKKATAEQELTYWLRFIASNSSQGMKRHVIVVLNTFDGMSCGETPQWCELVRSVHLKFKDYLEIHSDPIVIDARFRRSVRELKRTLFERTGSVLDGVQWPKVCEYIQSNLRSWAQENQNFPVIHWTDFTGKMAASRLPVDTLEAAVEYLHETGHLIYFRRGALGEGENSETRLIVLDPHWFCKRIVGELLLPDHMVRGGERSLKKCLAPDGSLEFREIKAYFSNLLKSNPQVNYVVGMLIRLGLCYKVDPDTDRVLIPALVEGGLPGSLWGTGESKQLTGQWVMGRSLALMDTARTALPRSLFRRLQVSLARDPQLGGMKNNNYTVGKSSLTFEKSGMVILVQCDVDDDDPRDDRIDTIAKPLVWRNSHRDRVTQRKKQIALVEVVMERLQDLCSQWCPRVSFVEKVILPWNAVEGAKPMLNRNTDFTVDEIRTWVQRNGLGTEAGDSELNCWVGDEEVREDDLLSKNDINELQKKMAVELHTKQEKWKQLKTDLGLDQVLVEEASSQSTICVTESDEPTTITNGTIPRSSSPAPTDTGKTKRPSSRHRATNRLPPIFQTLERNIGTKIEEEHEKTRQHVDQGFKKEAESLQEIADNFQRSFEMLRQLPLKVQNLEFLSVQQMEIMVPRFMYMAKKSGAWLSLQRALKTKAQLHLLCESRYWDGALHPVDDQRGVEISKLKEWASDIEPCLNYSIRIAVALAQIVVGTLIPGLNVLIPDYAKKDSKNLSALLAQELMNPDNESSTIKSGSHRCTAMEMDKRARHILKQLLGEQLESGITEKFGLRRVLLTSSSSPRVAWICYPCYRKYGELAKDLSTP